MPENAESRVREFLESFLSWEGDDGHIYTTGEYNSENRVSLYATDIAGVLHELGTLRAQLETVTRDRDLTAAENRELLIQALGYDA